MVVAHTVRKRILRTTSSFIFRSGKAGIRGPWRPPKAKSRYVRSSLVSSKPLQSIFRKEKGNLIDEKFNTTKFRDCLYLIPKLKL